MLRKSFFFRLALFIALSAFTASCGVQSKTVRTPKSSHTGTLNKEELKLRTKIVSDAKKHVGAKYRWGGKSPTGFDCSGFTSYVMQKNDVHLSGPSYSQENIGRKISSNQAQPGDLVFFRKTRTGKVYHVAMVYKNDGGELTVIHSTSSRGVVIDKLSDSSYWRTKYITLRDIVSRR